MKTFMNNKYSYLMAAAVLAGSMSFTACTNDEEGVDPINGPKQSVSLGFSVAGLGTKASADDVNLGENLSKISNIIVAPMVKDAYSNTIKFAELDPANSNNSVSKTVDLITTVDQFRVYGNLPATVNPAEGSAFHGFIYTPENQSDAALKAYMQPYALLYFGDTKTTNGYKTATITSSADWAKATWGAATTTLGDANAIKVDGVKYAVGVLGVGVREIEWNNQPDHKGVDKNEKMFYETQQDATSKQNAKSMNDLNTVTKFFEVAGITVTNQAASFNDKGEFGEHNKTVYETAVTGDLLTDKIATTATDRVKLPGANVYCVVSPTVGDETVTINIRVKNVSGKYFELNSGEIVAPDEFFFMGTTLVKKNKENVKGTANSVFQAATTTVVNIGVTDWGKGSLNEQKVSEITLGIEVDMSWTAGLVFNQDI